MMISSQVREFQNPIPYFKVRIWDHFILPGSPE
jgi:hypothetical protein